MSRHTSLALLTVVSALAVACTSSGGGTGQAPAEPEPSAATTRQAWIVTSPEAPVPIWSIAIDNASPALQRALDEGGCSGAMGDIITGVGAGGPPRVLLQTSAEVGDTFLDFVQGDLESATSGGVWVAVGDVNRDGRPFVECVLEVQQAHLSEARLTTRKEGGLQLEWDLEPESVAVVPKDGVDESKLTIVPPTTTAGLLLPAVQKVREAALTEAAAAEGGYPLLRRDAPAPGIELTLDAAEIEALGASSAPVERSGLVVVVAPTTGFALEYDLEESLVSATRLRVEPGQVRRLVRPRAPGAPPRDLAIAAPEVLDLLLVGRLTATLDGQPSLTSKPMAIKREMSDYWNGEQGVAPSFASGLAELFARASDEEGLWAYKRAHTASDVFARLDTADGRRPEGLTASDIVVGRLLAAAAVGAGDTAALPMLPGQLLSVPAATGHDYRLALAAVGRLADAAPLLVASPPHALVGVEPDEIDVAVGLADERVPGVRSVDALARRFFDARDGILESPESPSAAQIEELGARTTELREALDALRDATEKRFAVSR